MKQIRTTDRKYISWYAVVLIGFTMVWGFPNVINGFALFGGIRAIVPWIAVFLLYMLPYSLMVAELGSVFSREGGGVSSWLLKTAGPMMAFYAGWTYWVTQLPFIAQTPNNIIIAMSWIVYEKNDVNSMSVLFTQLVSLAVFAAALYLSSRGMSALKKLGSVAGGAMIVLSLLYIALVFAAPGLAGAKVNTIDWSWSAIKPEFDVTTITNFSVLVFSVVGMEEVAPYITEMRNPKKGFPKSMVWLVLIVMVCALLGTVAMGMMFNSSAIPADMVTNGGFYAFRLLGEYYHIGNALLIIYSVCWIIYNLAVIVLSIDAPLRILMRGTNSDYIPKPMFRQNRHGAYINGLKLVAAIVCPLIILPVFGISGINNLVYWLVKVNSVTTPLVNLWVFAAYFLLKKRHESLELSTDYQLTKSRGFGMFLAVWCFAITAAACIAGMYSTDTFELVMNIATPAVLVGLGVTMPKLAKRWNIRHGAVNHG